MNESVLSLVKSALTPKNGVKLDPLGKGGAGSGNFGHSGRPGMIGGSGDSGGSGMTSAINSLRATGGFTYNPISGDSPKEGYVFSPYPKRSFAIDADQFKPSDLVHYIAKNRDMIEQGKYVGGYTHNGQIFLDISIVSHSHDEARAACEKYDQISYYSLHEGKEYVVNENATSGGVKKGVIDGQPIHVAEAEAGFSGRGSDRNVRVAEGSKDHGSRTQGVAGQHQERIATKLIKEAQLNGEPLIKGIR